MRRCGRSIVGVTVLTVALLAGACGSSPGEAGGASVVTEVSTTTAAPTTTTTTTRVLASGAFDDADGVLAERVRSAGLRGGMLRVVDADGRILHDRSIGSVDGSTPLSVASSTKWLTAATFMSLVDEGRIGLDDDISTWLPEFAGSRPPITPRQLLDHTSGVRDNACQGNGTALATCVRTLASSPRQFPAGSAFS